MKKYELMYIVKDGLDEEARKAEIEKLHGILTSNGAKLGEVKNGAYVPLHIQSIRKLRVTMSLLSSQLKVLR